MPTIEFYQMPVSAPCRLVELVASLADVNLNKHFVNLMEKEHLKEDFLKLNPHHQIPFIVDGDHKMGESRAIAAYLVNRYMPEDNTLYPKDAVKRAQVDELLFFDATQLYASAGKLFYPRFKVNAKELNEADEESFLNVMEYLDQRVSSNKDQKFLLGDHLTLADVSVLNTFTFIEANDYDLSKFSSLNEYLERVKSSIPNYQEITEKPIETTRQFIKASMAKN